MMNAETKYLDDMDNAHEAFIDAFYESMGDLAYAQSVRKKAERKAEYDYQQRKGSVIMTSKEINELFSPLLQMLGDFLEKEGRLGILTDSEYRKMKAFYHYYEKLCLSVKIRNIEILKEEQKLATLPLYNDNDKDEGADICMKKKHSKDMEMC